MAAGRGLLAGGLGALLALAACGYSFRASVRLTGGIEGAAVAPFENRSTEPELGAALAAALREELARRGALSRGGARAQLQGEVTATAPAPAAPGGASWRISVEVKARLVDSGRVIGERTVRREADYAAGLDALETEGRRALAVRRIAADAARELVEAFLE